MDPGEQFLRDLLAQYPDDWETRCELVDTLAGRGDTDGAVAVIEEAPHLPVDSSHLYKLVEVYAKANPNVAVALLRGVVANDPKDPKAHLAFADVYATIGNGARAREHYRTCLRLRPEFRDLTLERRIGIQPHTPTVKLLDREQFRAATGRGRRRGHPDVMATAPPRSAARPARPSRGRPPARRDVSAVGIVLLVTGLAVGIGALLFWYLR